MSSQVTSLSVIFPRSFGMLYRFFQAFLAWMQGFVSCFSHQVFCLLPNTV